MRVQTYIHTESLKITRKVFKALRKFNFLIALKWNLHKGSYCWVSSYSNFGWILSLSMQSRLHRTHRTACSNSATFPQKYVSTLLNNLSHGNGNVSRSKAIRCRLLASTRVCSVHTKCELAKWLETASKVKWDGARACPCAVYWKYATTTSVFAILWWIQVHILFTCDTICKAQYARGAQYYD